MGNTTWLDSIEDTPLVETIVNNMVKDVVDKTKLTRRDIHNLTCSIKKFSSNHENKISRTGNRYLTSKVIKYSVVISAEAQLVDNEWVNK